MLCSWLFLSPPVRGKKQNSGTKKQRPHPETNQQSKNLILHAVTLATYSSCPSDSARKPQSQGTRSGRSTFHWSSVTVKVSNNSVSIRGMTCDIHSLWSRFGFASCFCLRQVSERMTTCGSTYPTGCCCYCTNSEIKKLTGLFMQWLTQYSRPQGNPCYFFFRNCTFLLEFVRQPITCTQSQCPHERSAKVPMNSLGS